MIVIATAIFYGRAAPGVPHDGSAFAFRKGRLWASINDGHRGMGLIDSGTSTSIFPANWPSLSKAEGSEVVTTTLGQAQFSIHRAKPLKIGGTSFQGKALSGDVSFPIIGNDFIFSRNNVLFTRSGLEFDVNDDPEDAIACVGMRVNYRGNTIEPSVNYIHLILMIDGVEQEVFFDTGISSALEAFASAPKPARPLFPIPDVHFDAVGQWRVVPFFSRKATLSLGSEKKILPYRHYRDDHSLAAPFVMGAGILKEYSILIDRKGRACFFKPR